MRDPIPDDGRPDAALSAERPSLREALRRARIEAAEHSDVMIDLKHAEIARLEILRDALAPVFSDVPPEIDLFDVGLVPGDRPRLFVDMVSFIEMGHDRKLYRFLRDGRHGRSVAAESDKVEPIVAAVTDYVARRLVERERMLAHDDREPPAPAATTPSAAAAAQEPENAAPSGSETPVAAPPPSAPRRSRLARTLAVLFAFGVGGALGAAVVVGLMVAAAKGVLPGVG